MNVQQASTRQQDLRAARLVQKASTKMVEERATATLVPQVNSSKQPQAERQPANFVRVASTRIRMKRIVAKVVRVLGVAMNKAKQEKHIAIRTA